MSYTSNSSANDNTPVPRAARRRGMKAAAKVADYAATKFRDRSIAIQYPPVVLPLARVHTPLTIDELTIRAVRRRDLRRTIEKLTAERASAAKVGHRARRDAEREARRDRYLAGCDLPQPTRYMHASARKLMSAPEAALLPLAA